MTLQAAQSAQLHPISSNLLHIDPELFNAHYNRRPFQFGHHLDNHPLLQLDALVNLANRLPPDQVRHSRGMRGFEVDFDEELRTRRHKLSLDQVLEDLINADGYVLFYRPDTDPTYRELLVTALADVKRLTEPLDPGMCDEAAYIFAASPRAVTPYHMDREMNFLCQVSGTKQVHLWDQNDRSIMSNREIDTFFAREDLPKPSFKPEYEAKAKRFMLGAGDGIHQPLLAPHAVVNGEEISIAIALTFRTAACKRRIAIHRANYKLRRLHIPVSGFGESPAFDEVKYRLHQALRSARSRTKPPPRQ